MNKSLAIIGTRGYPSYYGGFETLIRHIAPYMTDRGWDVTVYGRPGTVSTQDPTRDQRVNSKDTRGIESKSLSTLSYGLTSSLHAARRPPSVALVMNVANGYWLPLLRARGIPTVVNVDGIEWERAKWGRAAKAVFRSGATLTARYGDNLVFDAHEIGRRWREEFGRDGVFIPYGGTSSYDATSPDRLPRRGYALMVARFVPENTVNEFFDIATRLSERWHVVIVGSSGYGGPLDERARELAGENDKIKWFGHVDDNPRLFGLWENAGVYFHGHTVGGTNPALVQAMACGAPTVARDGVYNREVLGNAGLYVNPDRDAIAAALENVLTDAAFQDRLSDAARARQQEVYTWELVCQGYEAAFEAALRPGAASS
jgi:glycosyltransferase involved in cell wall biosynthesis